MRDKKKQKLIAGGAMGVGAIAGGLKGSIKSVGKSVGELSVVAAPSPWKFIELLSFLFNNSSLPQFFYRRPSLIDLLKGGGFGLAIGLGFVLLARWSHAETIQRANQNYEAIPPRESNTAREEMDSLRQAKSRLEQELREKRQVNSDLMLELDRMKRESSAPNTPADLFTDNPPQSNFPALRLG